MGLGVICAEDVFQVSASDSAQHNHHSRSHLAGQAFTPCFLASNYTLLLSLRLTFISLITIQHAAVSSHRFSHAHSCSLHITSSTSAFFCLCDLVSLCTVTFTCSSNSLWLFPFLLMFLNLTNPQSHDSHQAPWVILWDFEPFTHMSSDIYMLIVDYQLVPSLLHDRIQGALIRALGTHLVFF